MPMDSDTFLPSRDVVKCCNCGCSCSLVASSSDPWIRTVKRKYQEYKEGNRFFLPGFDSYSNARILVENECIALREAFYSQQQTVKDLYAELEEERNAASSAANEAMLMILRLQREKAEIQLEARQFKGFAEEKMAHDQEELLALEDLLYKREQAIEALTYEIEAYKHRMLSYGLTEAEVEYEKIGFSQNPSMVVSDAPYDLYAYDYPPLKCNVDGTPSAIKANTDVGGVEKIPYVECPTGREHLKSLEHRISQLERNPSYNQSDGDFTGDKNVLEKVIVGQSPRQPDHYRKLSLDGFGSSSPLGTAKEVKSTFFMDSPMSAGSFKKMEFVNTDYASEVKDDMSDRICTIDSIHVGGSENGIDETKVAGARFFGDYANSPRYHDSSMNQHDISDPDINKLYMRLQALEADRESLRQTILSMRTDKAQLVLLKEIAQHLSKETVTERQMPKRKMSFLGAFSFVSVFKLIVSFVFWKRKARRNKYFYGASANNMGLLMLLDKGSRTRQWRCLTSIQSLDPCRGRL